MTTNNRKSEPEIEVTESEQLTFVRPDHGCTVVQTPDSFVPRAEAESISLTLSNHSLLYVAYYNLGGVLRSREIVAWAGVVASGISSAFGLVLEPQKARLLPADRFPGFAGVLGWTDRSWTLDEAARRLGIATEAQKYFGKSVATGKARAAERVKAGKKGGTK